MRIKEKVENIDYNDTKLFFKKRAEKFQENNPYSVTMYQDNHAEIVRQRNQKEIEKLMPLLHMEKDAKVKKQYFLTGKEIQQSFGKASERFARE